MRRCSPCICHLVSRNCRQPSLETSVHEGKPISCSNWQRTDAGILHIVSEDDAPFEVGIFKWYTPKADDQSKCKYTTNEKCGKHREKKEERTNKRNTDRATATPVKLPEPENARQVYPPQLLLIILIVLIQEFRYSLAERDWTEKVPSPSSF